VDLNKRWLNLAMVVLGLSACSDTVTPDPENSVPTVSIVAPAEGTTVGEGASITFSGTATDAEDGELSAAITWTSDLDGEFGTGASVAATLSAGTHAITASVTDAGGLTASASISVILNPNTAPLVSITAPADGAVSTAGASIDFSGTATDAEDGDLGAAITWSDDVGGAFGVGASVSNTFAAGTYMVTATVTDAGGLVGADTITVTMSAVLEYDSDVAIPNGIVFLAYSTTLGAVGGDGNYTWAIVSGSLPAGLTLSSAGVISGTATTAGLSEFTVEITSDGETVTQPLELLMRSPGFAYVTNHGSNDVSVISLLTDEVVETIPVGGSPIGIAIAPEDRLIYVAGHTGDIVTVIDYENNNTTSSIAVGQTPDYVAVNTDGGIAYVVARKLFAIDVATDVLTDSVSFGTNPLDLAVSPDDAFVYVSDFSRGDVFVIDATDFSIPDTVSVGDGPAAIAITPDGAFAYVANRSSSDVSVIDLATNTVVGSPISVSSIPDDLAITPDGAFVYVTNRQTDRISVIEVATNTVTVPSIGVGDLPVGIGFTPDGAFAYVVNQSGTVSIIDVGTNTVIGSPIPVGTTPQSIVIRLIG